MPLELKLEKCPNRIEVRPTALLCYHAHTCRTLTFDLDLWPSLSISGELWSWPTHIHKDSSSNVCRFKTEWKQTDGQTNIHDYCTFPANAVGNYVTNSQSTKHTADSDIRSMTSPMTDNRKYIKPSFTARWSTAFDKLCNRS